MPGRGAVLAFYLITEEQATRVIAASKPKQKGHKLTQYSVGA